MGHPSSEEISVKVASQKKQGTESDNAYNCPIIAVPEFELWKAISPEPSNGATPNFQHKVQRVCSIDRRPHPLPTMYAFGASASECTWWPIINCLLYTCKLSTSQPSLTCYIYPLNPIPNPTHSPVHSLNKLLSYLFIIRIVYLGQRL